jgi:hypothetical protein
VVAGKRASLTDRAGLSAAACYAKACVAARAYRLPQGRPVLTVPMLVPFSTQGCTGDRHQLTLG